MVTAATLWGWAWNGWDVVIHTDNHALVSHKNGHAGYTKEPTLAALFRCLFLEESRHNFRVIFRHVKGSHNTIADLISRGRFKDTLHMWSPASTLPLAPPLVNLIQPDY